MDTTRGCYVGQYRVLTDEVAHHDEAAASHVEGTEQCLLDPIREFPDTPLITAEFVVIQVIDDDIVRSCFTLTQTARRLSTAHGQELHAVSCGELALHPVAERHLFTVIGDDALVVLELRLDVPQETVGTVLGLADDHHEVDEPFRLEHEPQWHEDVEVGGFGMTTRPHEDRLKVRRALHLLGCGIVERRIVYGAYHLTGGLVTQGKEMREIVFTERGIVPLQLLDALVPLRRVLAHQACRVGHALDFPAVRLPQLPIF